MSELNEMTVIVKYVSYKLDTYYRYICDNKYTMETLKSDIKRDVRDCTDSLTGFKVRFDFDGGFGFPTTFVKEIAQIVAETCPIDMVSEKIMIRSTEDETIPDMFKKYMLEYYHSLSESEVQFYEN